MRILLVGNDLPAMRGVEIVAGYCRANPGRLTLAGVAVETWRDPGPLMSLCGRLRAPARPFRDLNAPESLESLARLKPDLVLALGAAARFGPELLALPRLGAVNFHNSLLPAHAGANACTWAIVEGAERHGVTCHFMDQGLDSGPIVAQESFQVPATATAFELNLGCLAAAERLLERLLPRWAQGDLAARPQDPAARGFRLAREAPNQGWVDWAWPAKRILDFVRGLNLGPWQGALPLARTTHQGRIFSLARVGVIRHTVVERPGAVLFAEGTRLAVQGGDAVLRLWEVADRRGYAVSVEELIRRWGIHGGDQLETPPLAARQGG